MEFFRNTPTGFGQLAGGCFLLGALFFLWGTPCAKLAIAAELFVSPGGSGTACTQANPCALQPALDAAENNNAADTVYLAAGTYPGNFEYRAWGSESYSLTITGAPGTNAHNVILNGQNNGRVLGIFYDSYYSVPAFDVSVNGITIENGNSVLASIREGGGIKISAYDANLFITNCIIKNNTAEGSGGGIWVNPTKTFYLENNLVIGNTVEEDTFNHISRGAGAFLMIPGGFYNVIRNNVFARNTALGTSSEGGGLFMGWSSGCTQHLIGNTIYDNYAYKGAGVYYFEAWTANVYNNIIYANRGVLQGADISFRDGHVTHRIGYNNNYSVMYGAWTESGGNLNTDPKLKDPGSNDFHLQSNSPMVDAGTENVPDPPGLSNVDFEGNSRTFGAAPDIGADERVCASAPQLQLLLLNN